MITDVFNAVTAHAALAGITCELGAEFVDENATPPRIVWTPTQDSFEPGQRINTPTPSGSDVLRPTRQLKSIGTRWAGVRVRIWAEGTGADKGTPVGDIAAVEELLRKFLVAVHELGFGNYRVNGLTWVGADGAEIIQQGRACDVALSISIPIFKRDTETGTTVAPLTVVNTSGMEGTLQLPTGDITATPSP